MGTVVFIFKIGASIVLSMAAFASLLAGGYLWFQLWHARGESYTRAALMIAKLVFTAGVLISLAVFFWNPEILIILACLGLSLIGALSVYWLTASPYVTADWWRNIERSRKSRSRKKPDEESQ